ESSHCGAPGVGLQQRGEDADRRGLAGPIRAEERKKAALLDLQVEPIERSNAPEVLDQAFGIDRMAVHHPAQVTRTKPPTQNLNRNNRTRIVAPSFHSTYSRRLA